MSDISKTTHRESILSANPKASYQAHKAEIDAAIAGVLERGQYILGPEVSLFEEEFARYLGVESAIGVGSGTEALHLALRVAGIGPGDIVITVSHTAVATVAAIELAGATPFLIDVDPVTFTMDLDQLELAVRTEARVKAVIPVHLYGHPVDMRAVLNIAKRAGLIVIEDCAQAHGARIDGRIVGSWGDAAAFSFYPTKSLGALGDAGALVTNRTDFAERARQLRQYGWRERYISELPGMNTRLDEIQASILRVKLRYLENDNTLRREIARYYDGHCRNAAIILPQASSRVIHAYHQYVIQTSDRDSLRTYLKNENIGSAVLYPEPVHLQSAYRARVGVSLMGLGNTEMLCGRILSLPIYPELSQLAMIQVAAAVTQWAWVDNA